MTQDLLLTPMKLTCGTCKHVTPITNDNIPVKDGQFFEAEVKCVCGQWMYYKVKNDGGIPTITLGKQEGQKSGSTEAERTT